MSSVIFHRNNLNIPSRSFWLSAEQIFPTAQAIQLLRTHFPLRSEQLDNSSLNRSKIPEEEEEEEWELEEEWLEWERLQALERIVAQWGSKWGGVSAWSHSLEDEFQMAYFGGKEALVEWSQEVWSHADAGRDLLQELESWDGRLPTSPQEMRILWSHFRTLHRTLITGIVSIEARVNALHLGMFTVMTPHDRRQKFGSINFAD